MNFSNRYGRKLNPRTIVNVVKHYLTNREINSNFNPKSIALKTDFLQVISEGHLHFEVKPLVQRAKPLPNQLFVSVKLLNT